MTGCGACEAGLDHCHGTLLVYAESIQCTDPACTELVLARHELVVQAAWTR
jgi:hypothetical protein